MLLHLHPHTHTTIHTYTHLSYTHKVGKIIGQKWRESSEEEKQPYNDEYEAEKAIYTEQLKVYRNSTAYKKWLEAKQQGCYLIHSANDYTILIKTSLLM